MKRDQMKDYTRKLFGSTFQAEQESEPRAEDNTTDTPPRRQYKRKEEEHPRAAISKQLAEELELTPEMVQAINKIRKRNRTAREKDTRPAATYGLKDGYTRQTLIIRQDQLTAIKQLAKDKKTTLRELMEGILTQYLNR